MTINFTAKNTVGLVREHDLVFGHTPDSPPLLLESGLSLAPVNLRYETYGTLNATRDNAILIFHALSGSAHAAGYHAVTDSKPGWWEEMIGPGKAFDTERYFIVSSNTIGSCSGSTGPSSINPETGQPYGLSFPVITIADMVNAQKRLMEHLQIPFWLCVAGGSMGGMQAVQWAFAYPDLVKTVIFIASTCSISAQSIAFNWVGRQAIMRDPNWQHGNYPEHKPPADGLATARMLAHITYLSDEAMQHKFGRQLQDTQNYSYGFKQYDFAVESYLLYQGDRFVERFDANSYLYITRAIDYYDLSAQGGGSLQEALARVKASFLVISFSSDWLFPPSQSRLLVNALLPHYRDVTYCDIQSSYGHDAFLLEAKTQTQLISPFLAQHHLQSVPPSTASIKPTRLPLRHDQGLLADWIPYDSRVLDLGCGDGSLLAHLKAERRVRGIGIERDQNQIIASVAQGVSVIHSDLNLGLKQFPDQAFDYVILSRTLQAVEHPEELLMEMLRVGDRALISLVNYGYWSARVALSLFGTIPADYPGASDKEWHNSTNIRPCTIRDFTNLCQHSGIKIVRMLPVSSSMTKSLVDLHPNLLAKAAVFEIAKR